MPLVARYDAARSVHNDAQQRCTASRTASTPTTLRYVSCWPAKLANGRSSAVAEDRTATGSSSPIVRYASVTAAATAVGIGAADRAARPLGECGQGGLIRRRPTGQVVQDRGEYAAGREPVRFCRYAETGRNGQVRAAKPPEVGRLTTNRGEHAVADRVQPEHDGAGRAGALRRAVRGVCSFCHRYRRSASSSTSR